MSPGLVCALVCTVLKVEEERDENEEEDEKKGENWETVRQRRSRRWLEEIGGGGGRRRKKEERRIQTHLSQAGSIGRFSSGREVPVYNSYRTQTSFPPSARIQPPIGRRPVKPGTE